MGDYLKENYIARENKEIERKHRNACSIAVSRGSGSVEYESRDNIGKIEFNDGREKRSCGFWRLPPEW